MFLIILGEDAQLGLVKLTSEQAEVYDSKSEDEFIDYMFETTKGEVDLSDSNINRGINMNDALEIQILGSLQFNSPKLETKQSTLLLTIE